MPIEKVNNVDFLDFNFNQLIGRRFISRIILHEIIRLLFHNECFVTLKIRRNRFLPELWN